MSRYAVGSVVNQGDAPPPVGSILRDSHGVAWQHFYAGWRATDGDTFDGFGNVERFAPLTVLYLPEES